LGLAVVNVVPAAEPLTRPPALAALAAVKAAAVLAAADLAAADLGPRKAR
jgi:hypothetical protein